MRATGPRSCWYNVILTAVVAGGEVVSTIWIAIDVVEASGAENDGDLDSETTDAHAEAGHD